MGDELKNSDKPGGRSSAPGAVREFIVEFLGSLVPGIAFLIAIVPAFVAPLATIALTVLPLPPWLTQLTVSGSVSTSVSTIMFLLFPLLMGFFVFAYIAGHLFYRQDPKTVDQASFERISCEAERRGEKDDKKMMVRPVILNNGEKTTPVEFPYRFLREYLTERGIGYLAERVPWDGTNDLKRAKHFANALKLRMQMISSDVSGILATNEAHIRLSSSMWYVCRILRQASMVGFSAYLTVALITQCVPFNPRYIGLVHSLFPSVHKLNFSFVIVLPACTFLLACLTKVAIERALHYQRAREILFILELAHWLAITGRSPKLFEGLERTGEY